MSKCGETCGLTVRWQRQRPIVLDSYAQQGTREDTANVLYGQPKLRLHSLYWLYWKSNMEYFFGVQLDLRELRTVTASHIIWLFPDFVQSIRLTVDVSSQGPSRYAKQINLRVVGKVQWIPSWSVFWIWIRLLVGRGWEVQQMNSALDSSFDMLVPFCVYVCVCVSDPGISHAPLSLSLFSLPPSEPKRAWDKSLTFLSSG